MVGAETTGLTVKAYYSVWKVLIGECVFLLLAIIPLLPETHDYLTYTKGFYSPAMFPIVVISCGLMMALFLAYLPALLRAVMSKPAIEVDGTDVHFDSFWRGHFSLSDVSSIADIENGYIVIKLKNGRSVNLPAFLYRDAARVNASLNAGFAKLVGG